MLFSTFYASPILVKDRLMTYALFLGCTIPARSRSYEMSSRKVAEKLDFELRDMKEFICCCEKSWWRCRDAKHFRGRGNR